jgi:ribosomal protein S18 acetylase RimI-like enzyme
VWRQGGRRKGFFGVRRKKVIIIVIGISLVIYSSLNFRKMTMSKEQIIEVQPSDTQAIKRFISIELDVLAPYPLFYPEFEPDLEKQLSGRSAFFQEMEFALFIASRGNRDIGRCAALINHRYQRAKREAVGSIGYFAAAPDCEEQIMKMITRAEDWLTARGVSRVIAPFNGSDLLGYFGLRTAAYDEEPCFPYGWQPPYYVQYFECARYSPSYPMLSYEIDFSSSEYRSMVERASSNDQVQIRPFNRRNWNRELESFRQAFNETFREEWQHYDTSSDELHEVFDSLKPILDPHLLLFAEVEGKTAGFCIGLPDWSSLFRSLSGKLGPGEMLRLLLGGRRYRRAGLVIIGVLNSQRGKRIGQSLAAALFRRYEAKGLDQAFYHVVNESNTGSRRLAESFGGHGRLLYHVYDKHL